MTMQVVTVLGLCLLATLAQGVQLSDYLKFIPKFAGNIGNIGKINRNDVLKRPFENSHKATEPQKWTPPKFCHKLSCPQYDTLQTVKNKFEMRQYKTSQWVSTNVAGMDYPKATRTAFGRLFKYIQGDNKAGTKIEMTAPVITKIIPGPGPACESNFTMSFFVAIDDPPQPKDKTVFLNTLEPFRAFVRYFPGYDMGSIDPWLKEARQLAGYLANTTYTYRKDYYYTAGYDSPFTIFNRHNEIWFLA